MPRGRPLKPLEVGRDTREEFASIMRSPSMPAGLVRHAEIVLLCADGLTNSTVATRVRVSRQTVGKWRERFRTQGIVGLYDEHRSGRPRSIGDEQVMDPVRRTLETRPPDGNTHWSCRTMAEAVGVSKITVRGVRKAFGIQPHRQKNFKLSNDPFFVEKVRDVVGLYLDPPRSAGQRHGTLRRREEPDAGAGANPAHAPPPGSGTSRASRTATLATGPPTSSPLSTWRAAGSSLSASCGIGTKSS